MVEKLIFMLRSISIKKDETSIIEILDNSEFEFKNHWNQKNFKNLFNLEIKIDPNIFATYYDSIQQCQNLIKDRINNSSPIIVDGLKIKPNYDRIQFVNSKVELIRTPWSEINDHQEKLDKTLIQAKESLDFQQVGLICRTIMEKLANLVFDSDIHVNTKLDLSKGKFKNQLHAFIEFKLSGKSNEHLRKLAKNSIDFSRNAIDVIQHTTHKLDGQGYFAEICVISTISTISLIKSIYEIA